MTVPEPPPPPHPEAAKEGPALSDVLIALALDPHRQRVSIADLRAALGNRAQGALMFIFAVPNVLPTPPGTSALLGAPLIFLAAQLMFGQPPWLPSLVAQRSMPHGDFVTLVRRIAPWLVRAETLLRPRLPGVVLPPSEYLIGLVCLLLALLLVLPIPLGNVLPALAISLLALGLLARDGVWVLAGLAVATTSVVVVSGVVFAMAQAAVYLVTRFF